MQGYVGLKQDYVGMKQGYADLRQVGRIIAANLYPTCQILNESLFEYF